MRYVPFLFLLLLFGCSGFFGDKRNSGYQEIEYYVSEKPLLLKEGDFEIHIDSFNNTLRFKFSCKALPRFPFPKDAKGSPLTSTGFSFVILDNGKPIANTLFKKTAFGHNYPAPRFLGGPLAFQSDTVDLSLGFSETLEIPMYAFYKLKAGTHELELKIGQTVFRSALSSPRKNTDSVSGDTLTDFVYSRKKAPLVSLSVRFRVNVPQLFSTVFYSKGLELRNDSIYSPSGMDNTLWKSSYPDIYWTISYPQTEFYCCSDYQESTDVYTGRDTFTVVHYFPQDSISIGIWDHDNFSRDDFIAFGTFGINQFGSNKITGLTFNGVKLFKLKCVKKGVIN